MTSVYISCPWNSPENLDLAIKSLQTKGFEILSNKKSDVYDESKIAKAESVIFILNNFSWSCSLQNLTAGVLKEVIWCINNRKPMYIAYMKIGKEIVPYSAEITEELVIRGVQRTSCSLHLLSELTKPTIDTSDDNVNNSTNFY